MRITPRDALLNEFGAYYTADELQLFMHDHLAEHVDDSADRLVRILGNRAAEVAELLRAMAADPAHPLFDSIGNQTQYDWNGDSASWATFQEIARRMSDGITATIGTA